MAKWRASTEKGLDHERESRKSDLDYVIRRFNLPFGRAEEARGAGSSLRHRLTRSPDPTGAPESAEVSRFLKEVSPRRVPGSARNWIAVNAVRQYSLNKNESKNLLLFERAAYF